MSPSTPTSSSWPQSTLGLRALLVLTVLVALVGMHGLASANPVPSEHAGPHASRQMAADAGSPYACHTDDCGSAERHASHADQMCASGAIPAPAVIPALAASVPSGMATAAQPLTPVPYQPAGGRSPPSLAELQLLRI
ncbi:DUF6153 family protein [Streptomyces sp. ActVer]|uniref:DUF6153 family protein n=1 Tax=Streptomyces sp. ActVer TaxID=3014558 RepID=UPI0022B56060|nr:DUF6153 family protein [Streptomyces sp. ActVer]MCZ4508758.1 DUF6153 family protein [Streptomyces sp. ActVer]